MYSTREVLKRIDRDIKWLDVNISESEKIRNKIYFLTYGSIQTLVELGELSPFNGQALFNRLNSVI